MVVVVWIINTKSQWDHIQKGLPGSESTFGRKVISGIKGPLIDSDREIFSFQRGSSIQSSIVICQELADNSSGLSRSKTRQRDSHFGRCMHKKVR